LLVDFALGVIVLGVVTLAGVDVLGSWHVIRPWDGLLEDSCCLRMGNGVVGTGSKVTISRSGEGFSGISAWLKWHRKVSMYANLNIILLDVLP